MGCNCNKKNIVSRTIETIKEKINETIVTDEAFNQRINICQKCTFYSADGMSPRCLQCGCFLDAKARLSDAKCPIDKW